MDDSDDDIPIASLTAKIAPAPIIKSEPKPPPAAAPAAAAKPKPVDGAIPKKVKKEVSNAEKYPGLTADEVAYKEKLKEIKRFAKIEKQQKKEKKKAKKEKEAKKRQREDSGGDFERKPKKEKKPRVIKVETGPKKAKATDKTQRLAQAMKAFLWWNAPTPPEGQQWSTMEHGGVAFPEEYVPHGVKMLYDGKEIDLTPEQEEAATFMAGMDKNGMHLGNPKTAKIFINNFFTDFKALLGRGHPVKDFAKCDFKRISDHLEEQKMVKKAITDGEKKMNKKIKDQINFKHGYAIVDGHIEKVGNFNMEPPGTFRGRGEHPKMGKIKQRVLPEQVFMNFSVENAPPICPVPGHAWGEIRHDPCVQWLGNWKENINGQDKYMQLAAMSSFKGKSDRSKYNKAARLCGNIEKIRKDYKKNLTAKDKALRQLATAMWVIDRLALRVGGEKDTDEEADTVGCCSLRVEHTTFNPNNDDDALEVELEFLGKDSMLFKQTIDFGSELYTTNNGMGEQVYKNFKSFCTGKKKSDDIFETLTPSVLNDHLKNLMPGLSAKVFRTYNASVTLQDELAKKEKVENWDSLTVTQKVTNYNDANRIVAILCNHQRTVSKAQETALESIQAKLDTLIEQKKVLKKILKLFNKGGDLSLIPKKKSETEMKEAVTKALENAKKMKEEAKSNEEKIAATKADAEAKKLRKEAGDSKFSQAHLWENQPSESQVANKIQQWTQKIERMSMDLKNKDDNKEVSLGTSKINYMDPRATVAFCKRNEVPIDRVFSRTLRDKFNWAMSVAPEWQFCYEIGLED
mmetsp:Transcript_1286/g.2201  ORF Transcript_1286/g.2201 Transcript_1286/m.2201 type:complete len:799 (-) Transcript_1286:106-2502(-)|eukprot:CAMPEP_0182512952 /NCGR_PEP_ID=MMETSP1321-20130603/33096_1 /TAXON_ID=91990 /ORGANISM="Bolidomonas sp., Strain RCC1657" /LENGTH=798 /DNA_ID=CAMNT_0024719881 /DNA_START=75 /DNA_END=2471 /DNA_ORIENTATION=+